MFDGSELAALEEQLRRLVSGLEPGVLPAGQAAQLVERFTAIERLAAVGGALAAHRVAETRVWRDEGDRSAAHWFARKAGTTVGRALGLLETADRLDALPGTDQAFRAGRLSADQAAAVASAAGAAPTAEGDLLAAAATEGLAGLRERCHQVRAAAAPDEVARHRAVHRTRSLRHWLEADGAFRLDARLTADAGAVVLAALEPWHVHVFRQARQAGVRDSYAAYQADALVAMARASTGPGDGSEPGRRGPGAVVHVRVDHQALVRGRALVGERCEVPGVGPVPVATARALATDATVKVVSTDGVDVHAVAHPGRTIPAHVRTALEERDPTCVVPGCSVRDRLEIDHLRPFALGGPTRLDNLARLCHWHHHLKTYEGWALTGGPGAWRWEPPATPRE